MKKNFLYILYILVVVSITIYFSLKIIYTHKEKYVLIKLENCPPGIWCPTFHYRIPFGQCLPKGENVFRIVSLGDSFTFGHGVEFNETYSYFLEEKLNSDAKTFRFEVLNFGVPGASMWDKVNIFKVNASHCEPDLVILQYWLDDMWNSTRILEILLNLTDKQPSQMREKLFNAYEIHKLELEKQPFTKVWKENVETPLKELVNSLKKRNIPLLLLVIPPIPSQELSEHSTLLKNLSIEQNFSFLDLTEAFSKYKKSQLVIEGAVHPTPFGHKIIAEAIYSKIIEDNLIPLK
jgi:hypothetical protein